MVGVEVEKEKDREEGEEKVKHGGGVPVWGDRKSVV